MNKRGKFSTALYGILGGIVLVGCSATIPEAVKTPPSSAQKDSAQSETPAASAPASEEPAADVERDPELAALLEQLIVEDLPPLTLTASENVATVCGVEAGGCYHRDDATIYVAADWTDFRRPELLAHEYLHYVWDRDGLEDDAQLTQALDDAYQNGEGLGALVPEWQESYVEDDGSILPTELFSYACTGLRADQLSALIAESCAEYVHMDQLPIAKSINETDLIAEFGRLREAQGLAPLEQNTYAAAASQARAELFTPHTQVPLSDYPDSVTTHLNAGCSPSSYGVRLTRPGELAEIATALDRTVSGALTSSSSTGVGIATKTFDYIDAREIFDDRTIRVNATLIVVTVCK